MKRKLHVAVLASLVFAAHGAAVSAPLEMSYPSDAEASYSLPALDTYADQQARNGGGQEAQSWGVGKRQSPKPHDPFPFGGGPVDD